MLSRTLLKNTRACLNTTLFKACSYRAFSGSVSVVQDTASGHVESAEDRNVRLGIDTVFNKQEHAYVLTFPWNFPEIIDPFTARHPVKTGYWGDFAERSKSTVDFNNLYREFHQFCALPDSRGI